MPLFLAMILAALAGALIGLLIDRGARRWQPPLAVPAALGVVTTGRANAWYEWLPVVGWLWPLLQGQPWRLSVMRLVTELVGAIALAGLVFIDIDPLRLVLRAALIADLLLIFRIDWQYHLILDRTIIVGIVLASAAAATVSTGLLIGTLLAALGAALAFGLFYLLARVIYHQSALGFGDVLLAGLIGAAVGPAAVFGTLFLGMVLAVVGGLLVSLSRRTLRTYFAYGTYLAVAAIVALAFPSLTTGLPGFF